MGSAYTQSTKAQFQSGNPGITRVDSASAFIHTRRQARSLLSLVTRENETFAEMEDKNRTAHNSICHRGLWTENAHKCRILSSSLRIPLQGSKEYVHMEIETP